MMRDKRKVLFIGLDSAEPDDLIKWGREGLLPNLQALMERGAWAKVDAPPGFGNGALWPSLYTGVNVGNHGRYFFQQIKPGTYQIERVSDESSVRHPPVWKVLSDQGVHVCVIDGVRAPLIENLNGIQLADWATHDPGAPVRSWPAGFAKAVIDTYGTDPLGQNVDNYTGSAGSYRLLRDRLLTRITKKTALACDTLRQSEWAFSIISYAEAHDIGHMCWHLHDASHAGYDSNWVKKFGDPVKDIYSALDAAVGELLSCVDQDTYVVLFSGPGMEPAYTGNHLLDAVLLRLEGIAPVQARGVGSGLRAAYKKYVPFLLRRRLEAFVSRKTKGTREILRGRRKYFQIPHNQNSGAIRINVVGREPQGIVNPGEEYDHCCEALRQDLMALTDTGTGRGVVKEVIKIRQRYHGRYLDWLPDLLVVWNRHAPIQTVTSTKTGVIQKTYGGSRTGDHSPRCLLTVTGPNVVPGEIAGTLSVEAIAPTLTEMLGVELSGADGTSFLSGISAK